MTVKTRSKCILVLDDDERIHETFKLSFPEHRFLTTTSPFIALDYLRERKDIGLFVLDIVMPGINGIQVLREARNIDPLLPIVICTGYGDKNTVVDAMRFGANDYIDKPFSVGAVRDIFNRYLNDIGDKDKLGMVYDMLKRNNGVGIDLNRLGTRINMSPKYISRAFKERYGKSFIEMKNELRMERARDLLAMSHLTIQEIASELGYSSSEAFSRAFKSMNGISPTEYRELF